MEDRGLPNLDKALKMFEFFNKRPLNVFEFTDLWSILSPHKAEKKYIYALKMNDDTVKIGVTKNLEKRIIDLQNATGLTVLEACHTAQVTSRTAYKIEYECHAYFKEFCVRREYFNIDFRTACEKLDTYESRIEAANKQADEDYEKAVDKAWQFYNDLEKKFKEKGGDNPETPDKTMEFLKRWRERQRAEALVEIAELLGDRTVEEFLASDMIADKLLRIAIKKLAGEDFFAEYENKNKF